MQYDILMRKPFHLNPEQIGWVKETLRAMTLEEKIGQLFCLILRQGDEQEIEQIKRVLKPGGVMYRPMPIRQAVEATELLRRHFNVPMLIAANLEKGGNGAVEEGTMLGSPTEIAATDDVLFARRLGVLCGREGAAVGVNWAFAPIIDIDYNFRNPITNTRTFGSDPDRVRAFGEAYVREVQVQGLAASIKHFPGDGRDERDQHLVTSINDMDCNAWDQTYGEAYKASIEAGALTVMVGHIMQPAYEKALNPTLKDDDLMPASLSPTLMQGLLRGKLGFNGLIVTDATTMAGFTIPMPRSKAVPYSIAAGADVFLFTRNLEEDYRFMAEGVASGVISPQRLEEAVLRILGLKAALNLHQKPPLVLRDAENTVGCGEHRKWARECAEKAVTLVKEEKGVLPLTPARYPRILYMPIESEQGIAYSVKAGVCDRFLDMLKGEGFQVTLFSPPQGLEGMAQKTTDVTEHYDAIVYMANMATKSNQTTVRIEWAQPMGVNCPHYIESVPTVFLSVENPYHLLDVPRIKTYVNGYSSTDETLAAILDKLTGRDAFVGKAPHDPFCGKWDARL